MLTSCSFIFSHMLICRNSTCQPTSQHDISIKDENEGGVKPLDFPIWGKEMELESQPSTHHPMTESCLRN